MAALLLNLLTEADCARFALGDLPADDAAEEDRDGAGLPSEAEVGMEDGSQEGGVDSGMEVGMDDVMEVDQDEGSEAFDGYMKLPCLQRRKLDGGYAYLLTMHIHGLIYKYTVHYDDTM